MIPIEVILHTLRYVDPLELWKCRSVCGYWKDFIESPLFCDQVASYNLIKVRSPKMKDLAMFCAARQCLLALVSPGLFQAPSCQTVVRTLQKQNVASKILSIVIPFKDTLICASPGSDLAVGLCVCTLSVQKTYNFADKVFDLVLVPHRDQQFALIATTNCYLEVIDPISGHFKNRVTFASVPLHIALNVSNSFPMDTVHVNIEKRRLSELTSVINGERSILFLKSKSDDDENIFKVTPQVSSLNAKDKAKLLSPEWSPLHSKKLSAFDICTELGVIVSAAWDNTVKIWLLNERHSLKATFKTSSAVVAVNLYLRTNKAGKFVDVALCMGHYDGSASVRGVTVDGSTQIRKKDDNDYW